MRFSTTSQSVRRKNRSAAGAHASGPSGSLRTAPVLLPDPVYRDARAPLYDFAPRLTRAGTSDHAAIHRLLRDVFQGPSVAEFQAQLDEPFYSPGDRLVVKCGNSLVAHIRLTRRTLEFGPQQIRAAGFMDLATAVEYQGNGFASAMLAAAERVAQREGAIVGVTRTRVPSLFARQGWAICGRHIHSTSGPRQILAQLGRGAPEHDGEFDCFRAEPRRCELHVRPLRRIELPQVVELYERCRSGRFGWTVRSEVYWNWLMYRAAYTAAFVATSGPDRFDALHPAPPIAGYAFVKQNRIVELLNDPAIPAARQQLLARICSDAIERNAAEIRLDAPADEPLHSLLQAAGGKLHLEEESGGEVFMAKLLAPREFLESLAPLLLERSQRGRLASPQLALQCSTVKTEHNGHGHAIRILAGARKMKFDAQPCRTRLLLSESDLTPLFLGHWNLREAADCGRIHASSNRALATAAQLFPQLPWWRPPLDDLMA
jgi:predicted acetyltransferase